MTETVPFLGEIGMIAFDYPPRGWALCNGQLLPSNQNQALFALRGTTYGGNGQTTFALPDLRDRVPIHVSSSDALGTRAGEAAHTVTAAELPTHDHVLSATPGNATSGVPTAGVLAATSGLYAPVTGLTSLHPSTVGNAGGSQAHENRQPFLSINFVIALQGIFPSQS